MNSMKYFIDSLIGIICIIAGILFIGRMQKSPFSIKETDQGIELIGE